MANKLKTKPKRMSDEAFKSLELQHFKTRRPPYQPARRYQRPAGIQISLRLPRETLAKLTRLSKSAFQSKSQFITKLLSTLSEERPL